MNTLSIKKKNYFIYFLVFIIKLRLQKQCGINTILDTPE